MATHVIDDFSAGEFQRMRRKLANIRGPGVTNGPDYVTIGQVAAQGRASRQRAESNFVFLKITGFSSPSALGAGKYWALLQKRNATEIATATSQAIATLFENDGDDPVLAVNTLELIASNTHTASANTIYLGWPMGEKVGAYESYWFLNIAAC